MRSSCTRTMTVPTPRRSQSPNGFGTYLAKAVLSVEIHRTDTYIGIMRKITTADIEQRLIDGERPIELVSYGKHGQDNSSRWKCTICDHEWPASANNILHGGNGCPSCSNANKSLTTADIEQRLIDGERPIELVRYGKDTRDTSSQWKCTICDHEWATAASSILNNGKGCAKCAIFNKSLSTTDIKQRLITDNRQIELVNYGKHTGDKSTLWKCTICDHEWSTCANNVLNNGKGCGKCANNISLTTADIEQRLITDNRQIELVNYGKNTRDNSSRWKCTICDHEWSASASTILNGGNGCPSCVKRIRLNPVIIEQRLIDNNRTIELVNYGKNGDDSSSQWKCTICDHEWATAAGAILNGGNGCPKCAVYGFNLCKPGYFYLHTFNGFIKVGITNDLEQRHRQLDNQLINETLHTIENTSSWLFENGADAATVESMVLEAFKDRQHTDLLETSFDGRTELLNISVYDEIVELLNEVTAAKGTRMPSIIP